jgi:hypothetical protein
MDRVELSEEYERRLGCPPLIKFNGKRPLDQEWSSGPRQDPDAWRARLVGHNGNVGLVTGGGIFVVDIDLYRDGAQDALDALTDMGLPSSTVTCITGGGGEHRYYRSSIPVRSRPLEGFRGIEIKGDGGCVAVPPSVHPESGRAYEWEEGFGPDEIEIATPPDDVRELLAGAHVREYEAAGELDERDEQAVNILIEHFGAHSPRQRDNRYVEITRPGKDDGVSATVGYLGRGATKVWSSNWPQLPAGAYDLSALRKRAGVPGPVYAIKDAPGAVPDGYRLWTPADDEIPDPELSRAVYQGPVGAYLDLIAGRTEAHPAPVGIQLLACLGTIIGRRAAYRAGRVQHHCNLFAAIVGPSAEGAKGVADDEALALIRSLDNSFLAHHAIGGLGSGEALVRELADGQDPPAERRRVIHDAELSSVLKVVRREGSILGDIIRKAFDYNPLRHSTVSNKFVTASDHHVAVVGSITPDELRALIDDLSIANGFGNRFLYAWSRMTTPLPDGGDVDPIEALAIVDRIQRALDQLEHRISVNGSFTFPFDPAAKDRWHDWYVERRTGSGEGIARSLSARHVAHAARASLIYAALDGSPVIRLEHLDAAIGWCDYSIDTVGKVFACALGGRAEQLLRAVRDAMPDGIYGTTLHSTIAHNWKRGELAEVRQQLEERHLVHVIREPGDGAGRPRERYVAIAN